MNRYPGTVQRCLIFFGGLAGFMLTLMIVIQLHSAFGGPKPLVSLVGLIAASTWLIGSGYSLLCDWKRQSIESKTARLALLLLILAPVFYGILDSLIGLTRR